MTFYCNKTISKLSNYLFLIIRIFIPFLTIIAACLVFQTAIEFS